MGEARARGLTHELTRVAVESATASAAALAVPCTKPHELASHHCRFQLNQFGPALQLSCNPASPTTGFTVVMGTCPEGFRMRTPFSGSNARPRGGTRGCVLPAES